MTTLKEIAQQAGVDISTASKVLNGSGGNTRVSEGTELRIRQAARKLRYRPNSMAQSVQNGRANVVALVLSTHSEKSTLPAALLDTTVDALAARHVHLIVSRLPDEALTSEFFMPRILRNLTSDGLLIDYTHTVPEGLEALLEHYRIPAVWLNRKRKTNSVYPDDVEAGRLATEHLLALGHRRITMLSLNRHEGQPPESWHYSEHDRFEGYAATMRAAGLHPVRLLRPFEVPEHEAPNLIREHLSRPDRPTAILAQAFGEIVVHVATAMGLHVPAQLSVVDFLVHPAYGIGIAPTCALLPLRQIAIDAVDMLMTMIADPETPQPSVAVPVTLVAGETTAASLNREK